MAWPHLAEDAVDELLSHMWGGPFGILDSVRNSLHDLLHPLTALVDAGLVWVWDHAEAAFGWALKLYYQAVDFVLYIRDAVVGIAHTLYAQAVSIAYQLWNDAVTIAHGLVDDAIAIGRQLWHEAVVGAHMLVDGAIEIARQLWADAVTTARQLFNDALTIAQGALGAFWRDVVAPIEHMVGAIKDELFGWAKPLLDVIERSLTWLEWVSTRAVPEAIRVWRFIRDFDPTDIDGLLQRMLGGTQTKSATMLRHYYR